MNLSHRIQELRPSATLQISQRARELREAGQDVIGLGAGEPDFVTPEGPRESAKAAIDAGQTHYTSIAGTADLREAIVGKLRRDNSLDYGVDQVLVSTGAKQSLFNAVFALTDPGDAVLIPAPYWVSYPAMALLAGARSVVLPTDPAAGFRLDPATLERSLQETERARVFLLNSPGNPSGAAYTADELRELGRVLAASDVWVVTDEIYEKLVYDGAEHHSIATVCPELRDRTILVNGLSKAYAMTGWRVGYAAGPTTAIKAMERLQGHVTSNAASISQAAATAALEGDEASVRQMTDVFAARRGQVLEALRAMPGVHIRPPEGAFYAFPDISSHYGEAIPGSTEMCKRILDDVGVALVPGEAFGEDRCIRLSYAAADEVLADALGRLDRFFRQLPG